MFLGKSGKNKLKSGEDLVEYYKHYLDTSKPKSMFKDVMKAENLENYTAT